MTPIANPAGLQPRAVWRRLHQSLLPDYNRAATSYWCSVVVLGSLALAVALFTVVTGPTSTLLQVGVGMVIAMVAGFFPVRVPRSKNSFAAGETFIFLLLLVHGPAGATLAAAGEAAVGSWRTSKRWSSRIASPAMAALAMLSAGSVLQVALERLGDSAGGVISATMLFSLAYFAINTLLISAVARFKRNERLGVADLLGMFGWVGIAFAGSAAVAALLYLVFLQSGIGVLMAMVPLLAMMLATLHYFFRQQEAAETVRQASAEAADREKDLAQRHVRELEASERRFHSAFTHASIGMALLDFDGRILQANHALRALVGRRDEELLHEPFQDVVLRADRRALDERTK